MSDSSDGSNVGPAGVAQVTILVCSSCRNEAGCDLRPRPGALLGDKVAASNRSPSISVEQIECLGNCNRRLSAAMVRPGAWTYVFGDLDLDNAEDLIEGAQLFFNSPNELMPWKGRPECLKRGLIARIPPTHSNGVK